MSTSRSATPSTRRGRQELEDFARRQRGATKLHEPVPAGRVVKLVPEEDYGFIETSDGREIYFHRHSVVNGAFRHVAIGSQVTFVEEAGDNGAQASTVRLLDKH